MIALFRSSITFYTVTFHYPYHANCFALLCSNYLSSNRRFFSINNSPLTARPNAYMHKFLSYSHLGSKSILNKHIQSPASSSFTRVFLRENDLRSVGETASFLWVKVSGSGLAFAIQGNHIYIFAFLLIDLLSVLYKTYRKCFCSRYIWHLHPQILWSHSTTANRHTQMSEWIDVYVSHICATFCSSMLSLVSSFMARIESALHPPHVCCHLKHKPDTISPTWPFGMRCPCVLCLLQHILRLNSSDHHYGKQTLRCLAFVRPEAFFCHN